MAEGTRTWDGMAVPLLGESEIKQQDVTADVLTITLGTAATGDAFVVQNVSGTELFVIGPAGELTTTGTVTGSLTFAGATGAAGVILAKTGTGQTTFSRLRLPILETAPASAGLTKGDIWLAKATTDVYRFAMCISTATGAARYGGRIIRSTIGTASH